MSAKRKTVCSAVCSVSFCKTDNPTRPNVGKYRKSHKLSESQVLPKAGQTLENAITIQTNTDDHSDMLKIGR